MPTFVDVELDNLTRVGRELYDDLYVEGGSRALKALALEAGRMKDRLDRLDLLICGDADEWLTVTIPTGRAELVLLIDNPANQARLYAGTLRQTIEAAVALRNADVGSVSGGDGDVIDNL